MISSFQSLWQFNLELSLLLVLIIALRWALKKFANIYNAYWLWLVLPLAPIISALVLTLAPEINKNTYIAPVLNQLSVNPISPTQLSTADTPFKRAIGASESANASLSSAGNLDNVTLWLLASLWLLGALFFLIRLAQQHYFLRRELASPDYQKPIKLNAALTAAYPICGVNKPGFSPAVYGFFKPKIYFPVSLTEGLKPSQISLILQHEEQHIRQGHLWLNLVWDILVCVCWLNPMIYWARHLFRHDQELFCDYLVLKNSDWSRQRAYGHTLISTVSATHSVSLLCSWKMFDQLEERIMNIKTQHPSFKKVLVTAAAALSLSASSLYAIATANEAKPKEEKELAIKPERGKSINIIKIDTDTTKQTTIEVDGATYRLEDGERFILENGERRKLSESESEHFAELLEKVEKYAIADGDEKRHIFNFDNVHAYAFDKDGEFDFDELEAELENFRSHAAIPKIEAEVMAIVKRPELFDRHIELSIEGALGDQNIENALRDSKDSKNADVKKARKKLEHAKKRIKESQKKLEKERKEAQELIEKLEEASSRPV